ncbi:MAG: glutamate ligase domain-containing protein [Parvularculaceae bacterium]
MTDKPSYFFCGVGGSGMLPLALILTARGFEVAGSDRALDQGRSPEKFEYLRGRGIRLFPQDGSGVVDAGVLVASAAIEDAVPDVAAAKARGLRRATRAEILAELFNAAAMRVGIAGTSGKSTTTAMAAWLLEACGRAPTAMNGAEMKNFPDTEGRFLSALNGAGEAFVSEIDESDGSIALFSPTIAVLNNIAEDHKPLPELRTLFGDFVDKADLAVLNLDNAEPAAVARRRAREKLTYSQADDTADFLGGSYAPAPDGAAFELRADGAPARTLRLSMPGRHNVSNALAALAAARAAGVPLAEACDALEGCAGVRRRFEVVGGAHGVFVIDDFAHNPDKIAATFRTLREARGRILAMFQPHGYGPLRQLRDQFVGAFVDGLRDGDALVMPEPVYFGGTVDRSVSSADVAEAVRAAGRDAEALATRDACGDALVARAAPGDRIVVMGARDDTLSDFAADLLRRVAARTDLMDGEKRA